MANKCERKRRNYDSVDEDIKSTFLEMIQSTPFSSLNISSICERAKVSRSTFYNHFDCLLDIVDTLIVDLLRKCDHMPSQACYANWNVPSSGKPFCEIVRENKSFQALLFDPQLTDHCIDVINMNVIDSIPSKVKPEKDPFYDDLLASLQWSLHGCFGMIKSNLDKSDEEWDKIKTAIDRYNNGGLKMITLK